MSLWPIRTSCSSSPCEKRLGFLPVSSIHYVSSRDRVQRRTGRAVLPIDSPCMDQIPRAVLRQTNRRWTRCLNVKLRLSEGQRSQWWSHWSQWRKEGGEGQDRVGAARQSKRDVSQGRGWMREWAQRAIKLTAPTHARTGLEKWFGWGVGEWDGVECSGGGGGRQMELVKSLSRVLYQLWQRGRHNSWAVSCRFHKQDKLMGLPRPLTFTVCFYCLPRERNGNLLWLNKKKALR